MRFSSTTAAVAAIGSSIVSAKPVRRQADSLSPCANITEQYQEAVAANASSLSVDGELAYDCLNSMSFNAELASSFVAEVAKFLQFQSTTPFLIDPPKTYLSPAADLLGGIEQIYQKANSSQYQSQYEMDTELLNLLNSANDGHLSASFCSLGVFSFRQEYEVVSVSADGVTLPMIYTVQDALLMANGSTQISDIVQINGQNATAYFEILALTQRSQDPDARWNTIFPSQARDIGGGNPIGVFANNDGSWLGSPDIVLTFSNGSSVSSRVSAKIELDSFNFTDGESLFEYVCVPANTSTSSSNTTSATTSVQPTATAGPSGYGIPVISDPYNLIAGYYLDDSDLNDTAVLFVPSFETASDSLPDWVEATFSDVASIFVNGAVADGKTKIIIDVSGNGGGTILSGFDLFKLFFPDLEAYSATRLLDNEAEMLMMKSLSTLNVSDENASDEAQLFTGPFYYPLQVTPDQNESFSSWEELYGPDVIQGANFSSLYANFNFTYESSEASPIRGYGGVPLNVTGRPFEAKNILVISDGYCASTCTTFVNLMTSPDFGNVQSLAFGGRSIEAPMQIMGGVRGAQSSAWSYLAEQVEGAFAHAYNGTNSTSPPLTSEELERLAEIGPQSPTSFPLIFGDGNLNLRNAYNPGDDETPLQFTYFAADCKLFYTIENIVDPPTSWVAAAQAIWGNGTCVTGSQSTNSTYK